jgi:hypothetical protein
MPNEDPDLVRPVQLVIDTNYLTDVGSFHDMSRDEDPDVDSANSVYRRQRVRDALILAMLLDRDRITTWNLWSEASTIFHERVNPGEQSAERAFTTVFAHFVKDQIFPGWNMLTDETAYPGARGNAADDALVDVAKHFGVPLVSSEGFRPKRLHRAPIVRKAQAAGVAILTPRQYFTGKIDEVDACNEFMRRFLLYRDEYVDTHPSPQNMRAFFADIVTGYYQHVLYGLTSGRPGLVAVTLPWIFEGKPPAANP